MVYVRTYMVVTLRNVNLQSCLEMSICTHVWNVNCHGSRSGSGSLKHWWRTELGGTTFLCDSGGVDSTAGHLQRTYLVESSVETSAERSWQRLRQNKSKEVSQLQRSVNCRGQSIAEVSQLQKPREQEENRNSSKVESTYWGVSQARYCSLGSTKLASHNFWHAPHALHTCNAQRHTGARHSARYHMNAYS